MKKIMLVMLMGVLMVSGCSQNKDETNKKDSKVDEKQTVTSDVKEESSEVDSDDTFEEDVEDDVEEESDINESTKPSGKNRGYIDYEYKPEEHEEVSVDLPSENKFYVKDYIGKNLSTIGYYSMAGDYRDHYDTINIELKLVDVNGNYIDSEKEEVLQKYYVVGQDVKPNTKIEVRKLGKTDEVQSLDSITLYCEEMDEYNDREVEVKYEKTSPNATTYPIRNYVGKNLADAGYYSMAGDYRDKYGMGNVKLIINSTDGKNIDVSKDKQLRKYQVVKQNVKFNTMLKLAVDPKYPNLVNSQSIEGIILTVSPLK